MLFLMLLKQNWHTCRTSAWKHQIAPYGSYLVTAGARSKVPIREIEIFDTKRAARLLA